MEIRVGVSVSVLFTITTMSSSVFQNIPEVSYVTSISVFFDVSLLFTVLIIFESCAVLYLQKRQKKLESVAGESVDNDDGEGSNPADIGIIEEPNGSGANQDSAVRHQPKYRLMEKKLEQVSEILFALGYAAFCLVYFVVNTIDFSEDKRGIEMEDAQAVINSEFFCSELST